MGCDGQPLNGGIAESTVNVRVSALVQASDDARLHVAPWQRVLAMTADGTQWRALGQTLAGQQVEIRYDRSRGLAIIPR